MSIEGTNFSRHYTCKFRFKLQLPFLYVLTCVVCACKFAAKIDL